MRREYRQTCSIAGALDLIGERWTILLLRELTTGPKRFKDVLENLPGVGTNLLSNRLKRLQADGLVERRQLPPPAGSMVYALTEAGLALEPVLLALVHWGLRHQREVPADAVYRAEWAVLAMRAVFVPERARDLWVTVELRIGASIFHARVADGELRTAVGPAPDADIVVVGEPRHFRALEQGVSTADLLEQGMAVDGDRPRLERFRQLFEVPAPGQASRPASDAIDSLTAGATS